MAAVSKLNPWELQLFYLPIFWITDTLQGKSCCLRLAKAATMLSSLETEDDLAVLSLENLYNPKINPEDPDLFAAKGHS